jgi:hypothetical protein
MCHFPATNMSFSGQDGVKHPGPTGQENYAINAVGMALPQEPAAPLERQPR